MKYCRKCSIELILDINWGLGGAKDSNYICKECRKQYHQNHKEEISLHHKEYRLSNLEKIKVKEKKYYLRNKDKVLRRQKLYQKTDTGKLISSKTMAKRKRNLGFTVLIENKFNCDVDYHHINNEYVVAVPRYIHQGAAGKNHRAECNILVEKLDDINIEKEVEKYEKNKICSPFCKQG